MNWGAVLLEQRERRISEERRNIKVNPRTRGALGSSCMFQLSRSASAATRIGEYGTWHVSSRFCCVVSLTKSEVSVPQMICTQSPAASSKPNGFCRLPSRKFEKQMEIIKGMCRLKGSTKGDDPPEVLDLGHSWNLG